MNISKEIEKILSEEFPDLKIYVGYELALDIGKNCFIVIFEGEKLKSQYVAFQYPLGAEKQEMLENTVNRARIAFKQALESI